MEVTIYRPTLPNDPNQQYYLILRGCVVEFEVGERDGQIPNLKAKK
jgi:BarA-like signal transduction histidine kinase